MIRKDAYLLILRLREMLRRKLVTVRIGLICIILCMLGRLLGVTFMERTPTRYTSQSGLGIISDQSTITTEITSPAAKTSPSLQEDVMKNMFNNEKWKSDYESEKDSVLRIRRKDSVCEKYRNKPNILELPSYNKTTKLNRFNLLHHLVVSEKHKVMYCFIPKVACSNMKMLFLVLNGVYPSMDKVDGRHLNREITRLDNKKFSKTDVQYMLKTYYKFMLIRDPFERLVSAYRNKWLGKENVQLHASLGKEIVRRYRFNNNPDVEPRGDDVQFVEYVRYLIDTPSEILNEHWMPYNELCRPCDINYNFIGSIDTISRDITHVIRQINVDESMHYIRPAKPGALVRTKEVTAKFLKELPEDVFINLVKKFGLDHELFGYTIPEYTTLFTRYNIKNVTEK